MHKLLFLLLLIPNLVLANPKVIEVVNRFDSHILTSMVFNEMIQIMNLSQNEYDFRVTVSPGAGGEIADKRAIALARNGQNVLVVSGSSSWAFNRYVYGNTFDRDNDLIPLIGVTGVPFAIQVNPESKINTVEELVSSVKSKQNSFHATTTASATSKFFGDLFIKNYNLNTKQLSYRLSTDLVRGVLVGESDFVVYNYSDSPNLKILAVSTENRISSMLNIPTGKEIGFPEFKYTTLVTFAVPKENKQFGENLIELMQKTCNSNRMKVFIDKTPMLLFCYDQETVKKVIQGEITLLEMHKDLIPTNK